MHLSWILAVLLISESRGVPLLMSVTKRVISISESDTDNVTSLATGRHIAAVDYHLARGELYYSDIATGQILRSSLRADRVQEESTVIAEVRVSDGVAVDWVHDNLYWTDMGSKTLEVATLDGLYRKVLLSAADDLEKPRAIVIDPTKGLLFWSDWGGNARVESTGLDGKNKKIITTDVYWPNGLTLDISHLKLYILDGFFSKLLSCNYDGSDCKVLTRSAESFQQGFGLTYYANTLYWTSWRQRALIKINIDSLEKETLLEAKGIQSIIERMMGVKAVHSSLQPKLSNQDSCQTAQCSHHCLVSQDLTPSCICAFGFRLSTDGKTCIEEGYLLLSWRKTIRRYSMDGHERESLIDTTKAAISLGYHLEKRFVFWSDVVERKIYRAHLDQLNNKTVVATPDTCDGLTVDWVHDVLYWTDADRNTLEAAQLDGSKHMILFDTDLDQPRDIAVDPFEGLMFWTDWGADPKIEQSTLDGKERKVIISYDHVWPNGITLDYPLKKIYYVDGKIGTIYRTCYDGSDRQVVFMAPSSTSLHLFSITLLKDELYWTDWQSRSFYVTPKDNITVAKKLFSSNNVELTPNGIKAVHSSLQMTKENPCARVTCQSLCLGTKYQTARCMGEEKQEESVDAHQGTAGHYRLTKTASNDSLTISMTTSGKDVNLVIVTAKCVERVGCRNDSRCANQRLQSSVFTDINSMNVTNLLPASLYEINLIISKNGGIEVETFNITTKLTDPPEIPKIEYIDKEETSVRIEWYAVDTCFPGFSSYNYKLFKTAAEDNVTQEGQTSLREVTFDNLETNVSYTAHVYTTDPQHHSSATFILGAGKTQTDETQTTKCQNENLFCDGKVDCADANDEDLKRCAAIENVLVYKKTKSDVYLRIDVTNETMKLLEKFRVSSELSDVQTIMLAAKPCWLWPESYCVHVSSLYPDEVYDFKISAVLKSGKAGLGYKIKTITKEEASGPPENVRVIKHNATCLVYQWNHPNQSNGIIQSFIINIEETETFEEDKCCQPFPIISLPASEEEILYETATTGLTPASSYAISIAAKNMYVGTSATFIANTPPPPMEVVRLPQIEVASLLPLSWQPRDEQGELPQYHDLIRSYMLLLLPPQSEPSSKNGIKENDDITQLLKSNFGIKYFILWDNKVEETEAFKAPIEVKRLTARKQYRFAWVQVAKYKDSYSIDYLESDPFIAV